MDQNWDKNCCRFVRSLLVKYCLENILVAITCYLSDGSKADFNPLNQ